jgi:hypothetical protein
MTQTARRTGNARSVLIKASLLVSVSSAIHERGSGVAACFLAIHRPNRLCVINDLSGLADYIDLLWIVDIRRRTAFNSISVLSWVVF